eukprot:6191691-Pleurochrysis_carterae.AAC.2
MIVESLREAKAYDGAWVASEELCGRAHARASHTRACTPTARVRSSSAANRARERTRTRTRTFARARACVSRGGCNTRPQRGRAHLRMDKPAWTPRAALNISRTPTRGSVSSGNEEKTEGRGGGGSGSRTVSCLQQSCGGNERGREKPLRTRGKGRSMQPVWSVDEAIILISSAILCGRLGRHS